MLLSLGGSLGHAPAPHGQAPLRIRTHRRHLTTVACHTRRGEHTAHKEVEADQHQTSPLTRRHALAAVAMTWPALNCSKAAADTMPNPATPSECRAEFQEYLLKPLDISGPGPCRVSKLPRMEILCTTCFSSCAGTNCLLRVTVVYPKGGLALGLRPPYPLAIFSAGFLLSDDSYRSYAERLASWGYTVVLYDKVETVSDSLDDVTSVKALRHLIDWAGKHKLVKRVADVNRVYLVGHSRGGKLSVLAGVQDSRVKAVCLLDPVDNTVYAPLSPTFPSAVAALKRGREAGVNGGTARLLGDHDNLADASFQPQTSALPVAVIGSGQGGGCAPQEANYSQFFDAAPGAAWEVVVQDAGHFEYLDEVSPLQRAVCPGGAANDNLVRSTAQLVMVAWAEMMVRGRGSVVMLGRQAFPEACQGLLGDGLLGDAPEDGGPRKPQSSLLWRDQGPVGGGDRPGGRGTDGQDARAELESLITRLKYTASSQREPVQVSTRYKLVF